MFKNKLLQLGVIILIALAIIAIVVVILLNTILKPETEPTDPTAKAREKVENVSSKKYTAEELQELTVVMEEITAQLSSEEMVMLSLEFQMDSTDGKAELDLSKGKVEDIVNQTIADMKLDDIKGSKGQDNLKSKLINKINPTLSDGKVIKILIKKIITN